MAQNELEILLKAKDEASQQIEKLVEAVRGLEQELEKVKADQLSSVGEKAGESVAPVGELKGALNEASKELQNLAEGAKTPLQDTTDALREGAGQTAGTLGSLTEELQEVQEASGSPVGDPFVSLKTSAEETESAARGLQSGLQDLSDQTGEGLQDNTGSLREGISDTTESLAGAEKSLQALRDEAQSPITGSFDALKTGAEAAEESVSKLEGSLQGTKEAARESLGDITEELRQGASEATGDLDALQQGLSGIKDTASDSVGSPFADLKSSAEETESAVDDLKGGLGGLADAAGDTLPDVTQEMREGLGEAESKLEDLKERLDVARRVTEQAFADPTQEVSAGVETASDAILHLIEGMTELDKSAQSNLNDPTQDLASGAISAAEYFEILTGELDRLKDEAKNQLPDLTEDLREGAEAASESSDTLGDAIDDLRAKAEEGLGDPTEDFFEGTTSSGNALEDLANRLADVRQAAEKALSDPTEAMSSGAGDAAEAILYLIEGMSELDEKVRENLNDPTLDLASGAISTEQYIEALSNELSRLRDEAQIQVGDPTGDLQAGVAEATDEIDQLGGRVRDLRDEAEQKIPDPTTEIQEGAVATEEKLASLEGRIAKLGAAAAGIGAIAKFLKASRDEAVDFETRFTVIEHLIQRNGREAEITAEEIRKMSEELALGTLASVEGMEEAAKSLIGLRNVATDSFRGILESAQDLEAAGIGSLTSNVQMLGRAFEDPVRGMRMLRRAQIEMTDEQQNLIRSFMEVNDVAGAQRVIMDELESRYGGSGKAAAEGLAGTLDTLAQRFQDVRRAFGDARLEQQSKLYEELANALEWVTENIDLVIKAANAMGLALVAAAGVKVAAMVVGLAGKMLILSKNTMAVAASATAAAGQIRLMSVAMRGLPLVGTIALLSQLVPLMWDWFKASREATKSQEEAQAALERFNKRLEDIAETTGVMVTTMDEFNEALRDGRIVIDEVTGTYLSASQMANKLASEQREVADAAHLAAIRAGEFGEELRKMQEDLDAANRAGALAEQFIQAAMEADNATQAIKAVVDSVDLANQAQVEDLLFSLKSVAEESEELAETVRSEVINSLEKLNSSELQQFGQTLVAQFDKARVAAETFAQFNNTVLEQSFKKLGTTYGEALTGVPQQTRDVLASFETIDLALERSGLSAAQFGKAMETALLAATPKVQTIDGVRELRDRYQQLADAGKLTQDQAQRINEKLDEQTRLVESLDPAIRKVEDAYNHFGLTSPRALAAAEVAAKKAFDVLVDGKARAEDLEVAFQKYAQAAVLANDNVIDSTLKAEAAANGFRIEMDELGKVSVTSLNNASAAMRQVADLAKTAFESMQERGEATAAQLRRAFQSYAQSAITANNGVMTAALEAEASANGYTLAVDKAGFVTVKAMTEAKDAVDSFRSSVDGAGKDFDRLAETIERTGDKIVDGVSKKKSSYVSLFSVVRNGYAEMGEAMERFYDQKLKSIRTLRQWYDTFHDGARARHEQQFYDLADAAETLTERLNSGSFSAMDLQKALHLLSSDSGRVRSGMIALGEENLGPLRDAIESARRSMQELEGSTRGTLQSLQEELLRLNGSEEELAKARFARRRAELEGKLAEAKASGASQQVIADMIESLRVLGMIEKEEAAQRQKRAKEQANRDAETARREAELNRKREADIEKLAQSLDTVEEKVSGVTRSVSSMTNQMSSDFGRVTTTIDRASLAALAFDRAISQTLK